MTGYGLLEAEPPVEPGGDRHGPIVGAGGAVVRTLATGQRLKAGAHGWTWDGRADDGTWVAPGTYTAMIQASSSRGTTTSSGPCSSGRSR